MTIKEFEHYIQEHIDSNLSIRTNLGSQDFCNGVYLGNKSLNIVLPPYEIHEDNPIFDPYGTAYRTFNQAVEEIKAKCGS